MWGIRAESIKQSLKQVTSSSSTTNRVRAGNHKRKEAASIYAICCFLTSGWQLAVYMVCLGRYVVCVCQRTGEGDESANIYLMQDVAVLPSQRGVMRSMVKRTGS